MKMKTACYEAPTSLSRYCNMLSKLRAGREPALGNWLMGKLRKLIFLYSTAAVCSLTGFVTPWLACSLFPCLQGFTNSSLLQAPAPSGCNWGFELFLRVLSDSGDPPPPRLWQPLAVCCCSIHVPITPWWWGLQMEGRAASVSFPWLN